jgi:hypothetical protein
MRSLGSYASRPMRSLCSNQPIGPFTRVRRCPIDRFRLVTSVLTTLVMVPWWWSPVAGQVPGDLVQLVATHQDGVLVHPAAGDNSVVRWANDTIANFITIDAATGWIQMNPPASADG